MRYINPLQFVQNRITGIEISDRMYKVDFYKTRNGIHADSCVQQPLPEEKTDISVSVADRHTELTLVLPDLPVLYRSQSGDRSEPNAILPAGMDRNQVIITGKTYPVDHRVMYGLVRLKAVHPWCEVINNHQLPVSAIYRGIPEWIYAILSAEPDALEKTLWWITLYQNRLFLIKSEQGFCTWIQMLDYPEDLSRFSHNPFDWLSEKSRQSIPEQELGYVLNRESTEQAFQIKQVLEPVCQIHPDLDRHAWLEEEYMMVAGAVLCRYFETFSGFNLLPDACQHHFTGFQHKRQWLKYITLVISGLVVFHLVLLILFVGTSLKREQLDDQRSQTGRIQEIEKKKTRLAELTREYDQISGLLAKRTQYGRILYDISQLIPEKARLVRVEYSPAGTQSVIASGPENGMLLEGLAFDQSAVMVFFQHLETHYGSASVSLQLAEQVESSHFKDKPAVDLELTHFIIMLEI
jgi:Tfp pilus assembly protein PilN